MKLLKFIHHTSARLFYISLAVSIASGLTNALLASLIGQIISGSHDLTSRLFNVLALLIFLGLVFDFGAKQAINLLANKMHYELRLSFTSQVLNASFLRLEKLGKPRLLTLLTEDSQVVGQIISNLSSVAIGLTSILGCLLYLLWLSPLTLGGIILITLPIFVSNWWLQKRTNQIVQQAFFWRDQLNHTYRDLTEGIKELKLHLPRLSTFYYEHVVPKAVNSRDSTTHYMRYYFLIQNINQFTYFVLIFGLFILSNWLQTPMELLGTYAVIILYMKSSTIAIISSLPHWTESQTVIKQIEALGFTLIAPMTVAKVTTTSSHFPVDGKIRLYLDNLTYVYRDDSEESSFQLGPLKLKVQTGEIVFIIGGNGSGKTTLLKLLIGLYTPTEGHIMCNNTLISKQNMEEYQQNFSVISSEPYLFSFLMGLDWENLDERAQVWLDRLQLTHKVKVQNGKLSTLNLSFGQRKRLALLNAYLEDRAIYVFDEWAAGQDPEFRELFYHTLLPELKAQSKLILVITHDDQYFDMADRIVKLDSGSIKQSKSI